MGTPNANKNATSNVLKDKPEIKFLDIILKHRIKIAPSSFIINSENQTQKKIDEINAITWKNYLFKNKLIWWYSINKTYREIEKASLFIFYFLLMYYDKLENNEMKFNLKAIQSYTMLWKYLTISWLNHLIEIGIIQILDFYILDKKVENIKSIPTNRKKFSEYSLNVKLNFN